MGLAKRLEEALAAGRQAVEQADAAHPAVLPVKAEAVLAFGRRWQDDPDIDMIAAVRVRSWGGQKILITNSTNLALYQIDSVTTEFVPLADDAGNGALLYSSRKLALLCEKWNLQKLHPVDIDSGSHLVQLRRYAGGLPD